MTKQDASLDAILVQVGEFGKYQIFVFTLFSIAVMMHSCVHIAFVFSSKEIDYRCEIPGCDPVKDPSYDPSWLTNAVPYWNNKPSKCEKFRPFTNSSTSTCKSTDFDRGHIETCDEFVYSSPEVTIVNDFKIYCEDNTWKLSMVGTVNNIGQFVGLPLAGIVSDRFGRRTLLIMGMVLTGIAGTIKAFSTSYTWFLVFEFIDAAFAAGTFACGFILGMELVGPSKRVWAGAVISCTYAIGEVIVALIAWWLQSWRPFLLAIYIPPVLLLSYFWLAPESVRWLLSQGRLEDAKVIIRRAARWNGKTLTDETLEKLATTDESAEVKYPIVKIFKSKVLVWRFINCCFCWITCAFLFYGLILNSVSLSGNPYIEFILTSLVEIPAYLITSPTVDRWGRRRSQCIWFLLTAVSCITSAFLHSDLYWLKLVIYLGGKFGAAAAFTVIYVITSEIFPTPLRHSMMGACSMIGRLGSMVSPQMPLLGHYWEPLPLILFSAMATVAGFLSLLFPETLNTTLPDTIEDAVNIGKSNVEITKI